ncbi:MAG TPA: hypothetical protein VHM70_30110 [Polyangiaceae bacterium]|jgi:hypothetical protein|nr:hypothetical protein [Polyangiaceae bacterium]
MTKVSRLALLAFVSFGLASCNGQKHQSGSAPTAGASVGQASVSAAPSSTAVAEVQRLNPVVTEEAIARITNPSNRPPYTGATGSVVGVVKMTGDAPTPLDLQGFSIPEGRCDGARALYASAFREGPGRTLADALVAVTRYDAYLPPPSAPIRVEMKDCGFSTRTIALMFGQTLRVANVGGEAGAPDLLGQRSAALLVAVPGGDPIDLHPQQVGLHRLIDRSHQFAFADVYVLPYPTFAVTGLDGRFEITGIPVGTVKLNALLPANGATVERDVTITKDGKVDVGVLELSFDAKKYAELMAAQRAQVKPVDAKEQAERLAKAHELATSLVQAARSASTANQSPPPPPAGSNN